MEKQKDNCAIYLCFLYVLFVCNSICVLCQNSDVTISDGAASHLNSQTAQTQQRMQQNNVNNKLAVANHFNKRPLVFNCDNLMPLFSTRRNIQPQTGNSPFSIRVASAQVIPGTFLKVTIDVPAGHVLRGFIIQTFHVRGDSHIETDGQTAGSFILAPKINLQSCVHTNDSAVSVLSQSGQTDSIQVLWKVPMHTEPKQFRIRGTIVEDHQNFWVNVKSDVIHSQLPVQSSNMAAGENGGNLIAESKLATLPEGISGNDLKQAVSETFESVDGPLESVDEVLLHQGVRTVQKVGGSASGATFPVFGSSKGIVSKNPYENDELRLNLNAMPTTEPKYIYAAMNNFPTDFKPPETSEFIGSLLGGGGSNSGSSGMDIGQMFSMYNNYKRMKNMFGGLGGQQQSNNPAGGLGLLGSLMGGGGGARTNQGAAPGGLFGSLLGGGTARPQNNGGFNNIAPPPQGGPVNPRGKDEPSLADLLGVDPSTVEESAPVANPGVNNPLSGLLGGAGTSAATAAGTGGGGIGSMLKFAPIALGVGSMLFKGKKQQQIPPGWPPQGQQGFGAQGQQGFGAQGQQGFGAQGQMPPGFQGMAPPGQQQGQWGQPPQGGSPPWGQMPPTQAPLGPPQFGAPTSSNSNDPLLQQLKQTQSQLTDLTNKMNSGNFGQAAQSPSSGPHSETYDMLLRELIKQNQLLMEQNLQFKNNFLSMMPAQSTSFQPAPPASQFVNSGTSSSLNSQPPNNFNSFANNQPPPNHSGGVFGGGHQQQAGGLSSFLGGNNGPQQPPQQLGLANMFGGGGNGGSNNGGAGGLAGLLGGGGGGGGAGGLAGLLGGGGGGGGSPLAGLLGGGGGGGANAMAGLMGNVDTKSLEGALGGAQGQELMGSINKMMSGPQGGNIMKAMEGMMSGNMNPADMQSLMNDIDPNELMGMANQAQNILSQSGIDPNQLMGLMG